MTVTIWHHPRCSKSRQTLALLAERGIDPIVRLYLEDPPTEVELRSVLNRLDRPAIALMRTGEELFAAAGLTKDSAEADLIAAMVANPVLIERPVVLTIDKAALGRPPEAVFDILPGSNR